MKTLHSVVLITMAVGATAYVPTIVGPYYTMNVRLADGKPARRTVNQLVHLSSPPPESLTVQECNGVEVLAMQSLWMQTRPRSPYLTAYAAPDVQCFVLPRPGDQVTSVR